MELSNNWIYGVAFFTVITALFARDVSIFTLKMILVWPIAIFVVPILILDAFSVTVDANKSDKMFNFRTPTNTNVRGFAITVLFTEIQFYK